MQADDSKQKLLIIAQWYTPGYKAGGPIRSIQNLVDLLKEDFQIFVFTADRDHGDDKPYNVLLNKWIEKSDHFVFYSGKQHLNVSFFKKMIGEVRPQTVFLNSMFAYRFFLLPLIALRQIAFKGKIILAPRGMLRTSALRFKKFKKRLFLFILNNTRLLKGLQYQATSEVEANEIKNLLKANPAYVHVLENVPYSGGIETPIEKKPGELNLIFLGRIHPIKGLDFILDILISCKDKISLEIVGTIENKEYYSLCESKINLLSENVNVVLNENIPFEKAIDRIYKNHFLISPTHGENFGHAIFEALASGRPVIISDQTPWRDLEKMGIGWDIPLNDPEKFNEAITTAASLDQTQFDEYSKRAFSFAQSYIVNSDLKKKYTELFTLSK